MPNHVTHRVVVSGPDAEIERFRARCIRTQKDETTGEDYTFFDFNSLIPMPDEIRNTESSSTVSDGHAVLAFENGDDTQLRGMLHWPWIKEKGITTVEGVRDLLMERSPNCTELARQQIANLAKYGAGNWYDWSTNHWGTKWNSYSFAIDDNGSDNFCFKFDTAWSPPEPVFEKMAEEFPKLDFSVLAFDEGWGYAYEGIGCNGEFQAKELKATAELYALVYGEEPEVYDEDDDDDDVEDIIEAGGVFPVN